MEKNLNEGMGEKKLSVIILNWNGLDLLKKFIPSAARYSVSEDCELIVADNGSEDSSVVWLRSNYPEVGVICLEKNYGFAEGYNRALAAVSSPYVVLLNSDVEVSEGWWQPLLKYMESHPDVGACQPKIMSYKDRSRFEYAGASGGYLDCLGYPYCRGRLFDNVEEDNGQYDTDPVEVAWASGACLMVNREVYFKAGGLDPKFFAHMEEIDLCCRMWGLGYKVMALSDSRVYHVGGASLEAGNPRKTYLNFRNNLLLLHKNLPKGVGRRRLFIRRLVDTLALGMFLVKGDMANARAVLKAHCDFKKMRKEYKELPDKDILSSLPGYDHCIPIEHYLLRKKIIKVDKR